MVLASHIIFSTYGFWLPNDERGSWSDFVRSYELHLFGPAIKVQTRCSVASEPYDRQRRLKMQASLKYPAVQLSGTQARAVGQGFAKRAADSSYTVYACAILRDHVHLVVKRHRYHVEQVANLLKGAASTRLLEQGLHPLARFQNPGEALPSVWAVGLWKVFLDSAGDIDRAVRYVEANPPRAGYPKQSWPFVTPWRGESPPGPSGRR